MSERNLDEWCDNCKEYDHDRHCCHRFNRVIRKTVEDLQGVKQNAEQKWIPVSEKPNKRERYIVTAKLMGGFMDGYTSIEIARWNGYYWEIEDVMSDYKVTAYMPLPDPWRGEEDG